MTISRRQQLVERFTQLQFSNEHAESALWAATPEVWEFSPLIYRLPVLVIDEDGYGDIAGHRVRYTRDTGFREQQEADQPSVDSSHGSTEVSTHP
ncbi:hypothetical protein ACFYOW_48475 [Nocardia sp. NPDC006982]|uniref:hypothetical protein n=1 Tax=Nocardia sp. NPDC006982 TaxID=3364307 RepID=UPI003694D472